MVDESEFESTLIDTLQAEYRPLISENALVCLYRYRRNLVIKEQSLGVAGDQLEVEMPDSVQLQGAKLAGTNLEGAIPLECRLDGADLQQAILNGANLFKGSLQRALLHKAEIQSSMLEDVDATEAVLTEANLSRANVEGADFSRANLSRALFVVYNLRGARYNGALMQETVLPSGIEPISFISEATGIGGVEAIIAGSGQSRVIEAAYEYVLRFARLSGLDPGLGVADSDIASEVVVMLLSRANMLSSLQSGSPDKRRAILRGLARSVMNRYETTPFGMGDLDPDAQPRRADDDPIVDGRTVDYWHMVGGEADQRSVETGRRTAEELGEPTFGPVSLDNLALWYPDRDSLAYDESDELVEYLEKILSDRAFRMLIARYVDGKSIRDIAETEGLSSLATIRELEKAREVSRSSLAENLRAT